MCAVWELSVSNNKQQQNFHTFQVPPVALSCATVWEPQSKTNIFRAADCFNCAASWIRWSGTLSEINLFPVWGLWEHCGVIPPLKNAPLPPSPYGWEACNLFCALILRALLSLASIRTLQPAAHQQPTSACVLGGAVGGRHSAAHMDDVQLIKKRAGFQIKDTTDWDDRNAPQASEMMKSLLYIYFRSFASTYLLYIYIFVWFFFSFCISWDDGFRL